MKMKTLFAVIISFKIKLRRKILIFKRIEIYRLTSLNKQNNHSLMTILKTFNQSHKPMKDITIK